MLELQHIAVQKNGTPILMQVDLRIAAQEIHSILGRNGTGKTTLAYSLMGLPDYALNAGDILWEGRSITNLSVAERAKLGITLAWQEPARFEGLSVAEYLHLGQQGKKAAFSPAQCLDQVGLDPTAYLARTVDATLSGGERKRIELAAVLAMQPRLAILDEPDSGIDALSLDFIKGVIRTLVREGASILLITHHEEVAAMADRASVLCAGRILKTGLPEEATRLFRNHCQPCRHVNEPEEELIHYV
ncbi:ABC transporter, ATP-binding protein [Candidatus Vecturithrix granuli]|uniref:ABC transporter, ATP-binding protein n=1 Tax=Vecturithrix granuli TaxID=1499967 RepID=A0A081BWG9_VECG1|nr:ABC transporter, ATP-binding protein [Candidatus Vecturithrix granuli]